jgi:hypothetical protein
MSWASVSSSSATITRVIVAPLLGERSVLDGLNCSLHNRCHPFFTNSDLPTAEADITHRRHAIVETTFADLIDGPLAHIPSGLFAANCAWLDCAVIAHNLLRAAATIASGDHAVARGATLRRDLVTVPARFAAPARKPTLHLPAHWPWQIGWKTLWDNIIGYSPRSHAQDERHVHHPPAIPGPTPETRGKLVQASGSLMPTPLRTAPIVQKSAPRRHDITDPRIQA